MCDGSHDCRNGRGLGRTQPLSRLAWRGEGWPQDLPSHSGVVSSIVAAVSEDGNVREDASELLRQARGRCRVLEGRLAALLRGSPGEVSQKVSRLPRPQEPLLAHDLHLLGTTA